MADVTSPLKYHMNDLVYYYGLTPGGKLGKRIDLLGAIAAMAKGMLHQYDNDESVYNTKIREQLAEFVELVDMLDHAYNPLIDTNPYLFTKARRIRKGANIAAVLMYSIVGEHNLVSGNTMRGKLVEKFGVDRIMDES